MTDNNQDSKDLTPKEIEEGPGQKDSQEEMKAAVEKRIADETAQRKAEVEEKEAAGGKRKAPDPEEVDSKFVVDCLQQNELGDGRLYAALHRGKFVYNKSENEWFAWDGHHWDRDIMDFALASVENVTRRYLREGINITYETKDAAANNEEEKFKKLSSLQAQIYKRVSRLRTDRGRKNCLVLAHTKNEPLAIPGDGFDLDPWVLACSNGVIDLRTGIMRPGRPEEYIFRACPHEWRSINEPAPEFEKFLDTTFEGNQDLIAFVQRVFGYAITGLTAQRKFFTLHGKGQNGKGVLIETLLYVLGSLASPIQSEMLLDQGRSRSSAGPSPDIMALKGLRMCFASETDEGRHFSSSRVKWLSGGDTLVGRSPHAKNAVSFQPTHALFLLTNNRPHAASYDYALWERMILIPFSISFVNRKPRADNEREADLYIQERLMAEASGILAWLVRGCIAWQERGLDPPPAVLDATGNWQRDEDILEDFIEECCYRDPAATVGASELYDAFAEWYQKNVSKKGLSQRRFGGFMRYAGFEKIKSGTYSYSGIGLLAG